jgi:hypothetical protein
MPVGRQAYERTMMLFSLGVKAESPVETPPFLVISFPFLWFFLDNIHLEKSVIDFVSVGDRSSVTSLP